MPEDELEEKAIGSYDDLETTIQDRKAEYKTRKLLKEADLVLASHDAQRDASIKPMLRSDALFKAK